MRDFFNIELGGKGASVGVTFRNGRLFCTTRTGIIHKVKKTMGDYGGLGAAIYLFYGEGGGDLVNVD